MPPIARPHHSAFGRPVEDLQIVVIDPSRSMQTILRSMLQPLRARRVRVYDTATDALRDMLIEPPHLVLTEWRMEPMSGLRLLKVMRHSSMAPLCFVPAIVVSGQTTRSSVESAFRAGAHAVMVKPLAPMALRRRIDWLVGDARTFTTDGDSWAVEGVVDILDQKRRKEQLPAIIDEFGLGAERHAATAVDEIVAGGLVDGEIPDDGIGRKPRRPRDEAAVSPTLDRLIRQRAQERRASPARRPAKTGPDGQWSRLWQGR